MIELDGPLRLARYGLGCEGGFGEYGDEDRPLGQLTLAFLGVAAAWLVPPHICFNLAQRYDQPSAEVPIGLTVTDINYCSIPQLWHA